MINERSRKPTRLIRQPTTSPLWTPKCNASTTFAHEFATHSSPTRNGPNSKPPYRCTSRIGSHHRVNREKFSIWARLSETRRIATLYLHRRNARDNTD